MCVCYNQNRSCHKKPCVTHPHNHSEQLLNPLAFREILFKSNRDTSFFWMKKHFSLLVECKSSARLCVVLSVTAPPENDVCTSQRSRLSAVNKPWAWCQQPKCYHALLSLSAHRSLRWHSPPAYPPKSLPTPLYMIFQLKKCNLNNFLPSGTSCNEELCRALLSCETCN